jgi:hypothetical protein
VKKWFNLELLSGISVLITFASLVMVTAFVLPSPAQRAPVNDGTAALASGALPAVASVR